ncbi:MAPEG family protein [Gallaecimonas sp. GXIMD4217]|uniref:MAPEG family protein n=1 Tax=Gallaecimonas sp. GXIMD4217 TaxID=3131927 RepID=UPI00311AF5FE
MYSPTATALLGFIAWSLLLLILMEALRTRLILIGKMKANEFRPDNANLSPFMQRLTRAHANCIEGLPLFGGLMLVALVTERADLTDPLAFTFLGARLCQSGFHLLSGNLAAIYLRFGAFAVQLAIAVYWSWLLLSGTT